MNVIRNHHHEVFTEQVNKIALSADDDKRIILPDRQNTLAPGFQGWGQTERPKETQGDPGKDTGPWGGEFLCNFGHRWEVDKINKQREEPDPSIPSFPLLMSRHKAYFRLFRHVTLYLAVLPAGRFSRTVGLVFPLRCGKFLAVAGCVFLGLVLSKFIRFFGLFLQIIFLPKI